MGSVAVDRTWRQSRSGRRAPRVPASVGIPSVLARTLRADGSPLPGRPLRAAPTPGLATTGPAPVRSGCSRGEPPVAREANAEHAVAVGAEDVNVLAVEGGEHFG